MTLHDELHDLAGELTGVSWRTKLMEEWTPQDEAAYDRASADEKMAYLDWMMHEPFTVVLVREWTDSDRVYRRSRLYHNGNLMKESQEVSMVNHEERRWGIGGPEREAHIRKHPETAMPSERAALGLTLPPPYPGIIHEDPYETTGKVDGRST